MAKDQNHYKVLVNSLLYLVVQVFSPAASVIVLPLYTYFIPPAEFGVLALLQAYQALVTVFIILELNGSINRLFFDYDGEELKKFLGTVCYFGLAVAVLICLGLQLYEAPVSALLFPNLRDSHLLLFSLATWGVLPESVGSLGSSLLVVRHEGFRYLKITAFYVLARLGLALALVVGLKLGILGILLANLVVSGLVALYYLARVIGPSARLCLERVYLKAALGFSVPLIFHALAGFVIINVDKYLLSRYVSLAEIGIYGIVYKISSLINNFINAFNRASLPKFIELYLRDQSEAKEFYQEIIRIMFAVIFVMLLGGALFAPELMALFFKDQYLAGYVLLPLLLFSYFMRGLYVVPANILVAEKRTRLLSFTTTFTAGVNLVLNFLLIPPWGVLGAALATALTYVFYFLMVAAWVPRTYLMLMKGLNAGWLTLAAAVLVAVLTLLYHGLAPAPPHPFLWRAAAFLAALLGLKLAMRLRPLRQARELWGELRGNYRKYL